jgi:hypothetical protein
VGSRVILERGDMWSIFGKTDMFMITTNPIIRKDGAGVMGAGIAKQFKDRYPEGPFAFGRVRDPKIVGYQGLTNTGYIGTFDGQEVGFFMVKDHWRQPAKLDIIEDSVTDLLEYVHKFNRFDLNFPGIGNGKLAREDVLPLLQELPDNVHVWEYGE